MKVNVQVGMGGLQLALIVLKLAKVVDWPWRWVLAPTWAALAMLALAAVIVAAVAWGRR